MIIIIQEDVAQAQHEVLMKRLKEGKVLVATDVASRGLGIPKVDLEDSTVAATKAFLVVEAMIII
jgi:hypothetical protein